MFRIKFLFVALGIGGLSCSTLIAQSEFNNNTQVQAEFKSFFPEHANKHYTVSKKHTVQPQKKKEVKKTQVPKSKVVKKPVVPTNNIKIITLTKENKKSLKHTYQDYNIAKAQKALTKKVSKTDIQKFAEQYHSTVVLFQPYIKNNKEYYNYYFLRK